MNRDSDGCGPFILILIVGAIQGILGYTSYLADQEARKLSTQEVFTNEEDFRKGLNYNDLIQEAELNDFTVTNEFALHESDNKPYILEHCTFNNVVFELDRLNGIDFRNCKFINTTFNGVLIEQTIFLECIFEGSTFNECIIGKGVKYYDWTVSTITLTNNTFAPEHIKDGVNQFELFVENSKE